MNDRELDEMLNLWKVPPVPASLRARVREGIEAKPISSLRLLFPGWKFLTAGAAVVVAVFVLANTSAFSEKVPRPPFTVDSEIIIRDTRYMEAYEPVNAVMTSYNQAGSEVMLSWLVPDHPLQSALWGVKLAFGNAVEQFKRTFLLDPDREGKDHGVVYMRVGDKWVVGERQKLVESGCRPVAGGESLVGEQTILNYPTTGVQETGHTPFETRRVTVWMAPQLSCFALRATLERQDPDGTWKLISEKNALKVMVNQ
jgi:hypothetical protein